MFSETTRAGIVAIIGMPNAGKSTLLNYFLGSKLSIVSPAAQTTRERIVGIDTTDGVQMVFLDTPGVVDPAYLLHHSMLNTIDGAMADADVILLLIDATRAPPSFGPELLERLRGAGSRLIVALNKSDAADDDRRAALARWVDERLGREALEVSARNGDGMDILRDRIRDALPLSPFLYPEDDISTQSVRFFVAELIRETVFEQYAEEIPYSVAVRVEEFREGDDPLFIGATIYVERSSQKGILIGQRGAAIRQLGTVSRAKIEEFVERRIYLDLRVKVLPKWRKDPVELRRFGFPVPQPMRDNA